jgi:branched-chain amino acid transport system ATP-binding protein
MTPLIRPRALARGRGTTRRVVEGAGLLRVCSTYPYRRAFARHLPRLRGRKKIVTRTDTKPPRNARDIRALYLRAEHAENDGSVGNVVPEDTILETEDLTKEFAGFVAVRGVNLRVRRGSIHALIGPNGAGKTTCFNLLTKFMAPTRGRIVFDGRDITALKPADVAQLGLGRSFQISAVFPHLTVLENVRIALQRQRGTSFDFWRSKRILSALDERAEALIADVGLSPYVNAPAVELPYGRKRALEIATTLALDPDLMLLDEPMAGMGREDIARISALIKAVGAKRTVLMVEHNLSVVSDLCDCITVLTRGQVLAEGDYKTVSANPAVREAYLGTGHG